MYTDEPNSRIVYRKSTSTAGYPPHITSGVVGFTAAKGFRNGVLDGNIGVTNFSNNDLELFIGASNTNGSAASWLNGKVQAFAIYDIGLTDVQMIAIQNAMGVLSETTPPF